MTTSTTAPMYHGKQSRAFAFRALRNLFFLLACSLSMSIHAAWTKPITNEIWALSSGSVNHRWLVIHNLASAVEDGVYHIEVMERSPGGKPWQFRHLAKHMAISEEALRASLIKPMKRGAVYPETFNDAFSQWKKQSVEGQADVCQTSVAACLK